LPAHRRFVVFSQAGLTRRLVVRARLTATAKLLRRTRQEHAVVMEQRSVASVGPTTLHSESLADVVERLRIAYEHQLSPATVIGVVRRCRRELDIISGPALPEMLERLARHRLGNLVERQSARALDRTG
jgi:hypothetical protein